MLTNDTIGYFRLENKTFYYLETEGERCFDPGSILMDRLIKHKLTPSPLDTKESPFLMTTYKEVEPRNPEIHAFYISDFQKKKLAAKPQSDGKVTW